MRVIKLPTRGEVVADILSEAAGLGAEDVIVVAVTGDHVEALSSLCDSFVAIGALRAAELALLRSDRW